MPMSLGPAITSVGPPCDLSVPNLKTPAVPGIAGQSSPHALVEPPQISVSGEHLPERSQMTAHVDATTSSDSGSVLFRYPIPDMEVRNTFLCTVESEVGTREVQSCPGSVFRGPASPPRPASPQRRAAHGHMTPLWLGVCDAFNSGEDLVDPSFQHGQYDTEAPSAALRGEKDPTPHSGSSAGHGSSTVVSPAAGVAIGRPATAPSVVRNAFIDFASGTPLLPEGFFQEQEAAVTGTTPTVSPSNPNHTATEECTAGAHVDEVALAVASAAAAAHAPDAVWSPGTAESVLGQQAVTKVVPVTAAEPSQAPPPALPAASLRAPRKTRPPAARAPRGAVERPRKNAVVGKPRAATAGGPGRPPESEIGHGVIPEAAVSWKKKEEAKLKDVCRDVGKTCVERSPDTFPLKGNAVDDNRIQAFMRKWGLDARSESMFRSLSREAQESTFAEFNPAADTFNVNARFMAWLQRRGEKASGEEFALFCQRWCLDERVQQFLWELPSDVRRAVVSGFCPTPDTKNIGARLIAFARSQALKLKRPEAPIGARPLQAPGPAVGGCLASVDKEHAESVRVFVDRWGLSEESRKTFGAVPWPFQRDIIASFQPPANTRDINARFQAFLSSRCQSRPSMPCRLVQ
mmetsp:Transcript_122464/g.236104  ORF Transcript_122464/g.236104 Transcript_122464/m.236104 type:complete len:632 (-) Transcript_122464:55-1950(-)